MLLSPFCSTRADPGWKLVIVPLTMNQLIPGSRQGFESRAVSENSNGGAEHAGTATSGGGSLDLDAVAGDQRVIGRGLDKETDVAILDEQVSTVSAEIGYGGLEVDREFLVGLGVGERSDGSERSQGSDGRSRRGR